MRKILALLLALIMCVGVFAACGEDKEPAANDPGTTDPGKTEEPGKTDEPGKTEDPGKTEEPGKTDEPSNPDAPAVPEGYKRTKVTFDMTDTYTLVIETVGAATIHRVGIRSEEGKVGAGYYNPIGRRTIGFEFNWSDFGLEGRPWEYLGSEFEIDVKQFEEKELKNTVYQIATKPVKSVWCEKADSLVFPDDKSVKMSDGTVLDLSIMNYGGLRQNLLFNEGGQYLPNWNWVKNCNSPTDLVFTLPSYNYGYYVFIHVPQYGKNFITDLPADLNVNDGLENVDVIPAAHAGAVGSEYIVVANDQRNLAAGDPAYKNSIRIVLRTAYENYLAGTALPHEILNLNYTDANNDFIGTVLLVDYNSVEEKIMGVYLTGEKITLPAA